jgi:hypothetical protein
LIAQLLQAQTPCIEMNRLATNDIAAIHRTFGVEAARAAIVREVGCSL